MSNKKKIIIIVLILIFIVGGGLVIFIKSKDKNLEEVKAPEVIDNVFDYNYELEDRDTEVYKENFLKLKDCLMAEEINYEDYASYATKLFLIDLYTINNKISKYDVGGLEFIHPDSRVMYQNKLMDTMYKLVLDNSSKNRNQSLPEVTDVLINNINKTTYEYANKNYAAYEIEADIVYKQDLGYDEKVKVTIIFVDNYAYVANLVSIA